MCNAGAQRIQRRSHAFPGHEPECQRHEEGMGGRVRRSLTVDVKAGCRIGKMGQHCRVQAFGPGPVALGIAALPQHLGDLAHTDESGMAEGVDHGIVRDHLVTIAFQGRPVDDILEIVGIDRSDEFFRPG